MATIRERTSSSGKTRYHVQIRLKGYPQETASFDRKTDAREWAHRVEAEMKAGRYFKTDEAKRRTVSDMIDRYVRDVLPLKRSSTQDSQGVILNWWRNRIGHMVLADIAPPVIAEARDELLSGSTHQSNRRSPSTVVRYLSTLSHCYSVAEREWGWIENSPMHRVNKPREPQGRVRFLSDEERVRLLKACRESRNPYLYVIVLLAISTAMRQGEILNLSWDRVDFDRGRITLLAEDTKSGASRAVPLAGPAFEELRELARLRRINTNLLFPAPTNNDGEPRPIEIRNAWLRAVKAAGIENFRFHDLRHTAASYLAMNGATLAEIAEVLGHKTLAMVKRYAHLTEQHTSEVVKRMNAAVFGG